ncbi:hypothetical protein GLOTRDRAFT_134684 [Gloeophyllum trabeum ATCC 11539]|uniref:Reverse transcriptase Ty1/copia-type domain-containing protein n=1 Tax=Gloeophyllum trabeum (strain ATCC 11539 / FP-39264 / Madison 617) TaxID=670483 RepID=S7PQI3_GLOTA|nr:uncharacterized protein GLOTRDRAFT_134684 [Gloeophyllum trabeum ATCC 11539]EPQ49728.1 hypothetical protein GLOTRDRAFT_134684 [Gloeophyllum trabeum ATCC 11539]
MLSSMKDIPHTDGEEVSAPNNLTGLLPDQGGVDSDDDDLPAPPRPITPPPAHQAPLQPPPAPRKPTPAPAPRQLPPRSSRFQGSLREPPLRQPTAPRITVEMRPAAHPETRSASPDPLNLIAPTSSPVEAPESAPSSPMPEQHSDRSSSPDPLLLSEAQCGAAMIMEGLNHVYTGQTTDYLDYDEALEFAFHSVCQAHQERHGEPRTFAEAMKRPAEERERWHKAAQDEIQALVDNEVFELVELPPGRKAIGSRWVFRVKRNADVLRSDAWSLFVD